MEKEYYKVIINDGTKDGIRLYFASFGTTLITVSFTKDNKVYSLTTNEKFDGYIPYISKTKCSEGLFWLYFTRAKESIAKSAGNLHGIMVHGTQNS